MLRFRLSTVLVSTALLAVALGWWIDHRQLQNEIDNRTAAISNFGEKQQLWSPHAYLHKDTSHYESLLGSRVKFDGRHVESSQGLGRPNLRLPTRETLDSVVDLLNDPDTSVRINAAELLSLYLQAASGSKSFDYESFDIRAYFNAIGLAKTYRLLDDESPTLRAAAALILGNTLYVRHTERILIRAFDNEDNENVKWKLNWAYWAIGNNYERAWWHVEKEKAQAANGAAEQRIAAEP